VSDGRFADYFTDMNEAKRQFTSINKIAIENDLPLRKLSHTITNQFCSRKCVEEFETKNHITWIDMAQKLPKTQGRTSAKPSSSQTISSSSNPFWLRKNSFIFISIIFFPPIGFLIGLYMRKNNPHLIADDQWIRIKKKNGFIQF
jgi:hypothetical protein